MKRVRLRIDPGSTAVHPGYALVTGGAEYLSTVEIVNWNVSTDPSGQLFRMEGDVDATRAALDDLSEVVGYEITTIDENTFYAYVKSTATAIARGLMDTFTRGSLLVVPPVECNRDGTLAMTLVGSSPEVQAAIDGVPEEVETTVERIGGDEMSRDAAAARLSERQREAVRTGIEVGYYATPRAVTIEDVAAAMDCSPSTAAEHLRKAETKLIRGLFA